MKKNKLVKGLIVGKFWPPHKGHHFLIETALKNCDELDILVCDSPLFTISASLRAEWLQDAHPSARVHIIEDIGKDDNSEAWAKHTVKFLGYAPDIVFSSEDYGTPYAKYMGAKHHMVDNSRKLIPVSARFIRKDVIRYWKYLRPEIRKKFAVRVCILGAESTGTTTLSRALAKEFKTTWVPEYGRFYSEAIAHANYQWANDDFVHIAKTQTEIEDRMAGASNGLLICDTNAFATRLWQERYMGKIADGVDQVGKKSIVHLYIITDVDIPFVQDGTRDSEHIRENMHKRFVDEVAKTKVPYIIVSGSRGVRLKTAKKRITKLIQEKVTI